MSICPTHLSLNDRKSPLGGAGNLFVVHEARLPALHDLGLESAIDHPIRISGDVVVD